MKTTLVCAVSFVALLAPPTPAIGQAADPWSGPPVPVDLVLWPGEVARVGDYIVPHRAMWTVTTLTDSKPDSLLGYWTDDYTIVEAEPAPHLQIRQSFVGVDGRLLTGVVNTLDRGSLRPIVVDIWGGDGASLRARYRDRAVEGLYWSSPDAEPSEFGSTLRRPVWDIISTGYLLFGRDLEPGFKLALPYFPITPGSGDLVWEVLSVGEKQWIDVLDQPEEVWVITTLRGWRMWVVQRPPYVVRTEIPDRSGRMRRWELAELHVFEALP